VGHFSNLNQENKELKIYSPFGPSIGHCKLPKELIDDFNKDCEHIMDHKVKKKTHDFSDDLVGNVKQELVISPDVFEKWAPYFQKLMIAYISAHPENTNELQRIKFRSAWYVRTFNGDFNPAHYHTNCHISCVGYLSLPDNIQEEWDREDKDHYPSAGNIEMQYGQVQLFSTNAVRMRPKVGDYYIFPWWMYHMVYPFKTKGERRSFSFNVYGEPKEEPKPKSTIII
tara:strand:+ start:66 stop:746 length:681 start_codon:yes stop_codon:yes gene_type:complete